MLCLPPPETTVPQMVPVTAAVHPLQIHRALKPVEVGRTLTSVADELCPAEFRDRLIISIDGEIVEPSEWDSRRVVPSSVIVLRAVPGDGSTIKNIERTVLTIAVIAIAFAILGPVGGFIAGGLFTAGSLGATIAYGVAMAGITSIGMLAINALIPPASINNASSTRTFGIAGIQNQELPYGVVPRICGRTLITPPKGAHSYTTSAGQHTWLFALFDLGPGPIAISDIKIGQTPIDDFADVEYETREGRNTDSALTLFTNAVTQTPLALGLLAQYDTATQRTPINTVHIEVDISNPGGLFTTDNKGNLTQFTQNFQVTVKDLSGTVLQSHTISMTDATTSAVTQTFVLDDRAAGQYDVTVERLNAPPSSQHGSAAAYWSAIRTWAPSGALLPQSHAKIAIKIKATEQLNGDIQNLSCIAQAYVNVWDGLALTEQLNTHPAWQALKILQDASSNARPLDSSRIDLDSLKEWADAYPEAEFNYVFSNRTTIWQALRTIGSAGRAVPVIRDGLYGYIFDRTQDTPVQVFTARNVANFKATKNFFDEVQAMEIRYLSETMGWQQHSVFAYASGFNAGNTDATKISPLELTGVTSDDWAYKLGTYFFACSILRPVLYQFDTDLDHLACNPGDRVLVQHDIINAGVAAGRIKAITRDGSTHITSITLDEAITGDGTSTYSFVGRTALGTVYSIPVTVPTSQGAVYTVSGSPFNDSGDELAIGDLGAIATTTQTMLDAIVKTIIPKQDFKATVVCLDYAPSVHDGDLVTPPPVVNDRIDKFVHALPVSSVVIDSLIADESSSTRNAKGVLTPQIHGHFYVVQDGLTPNEFDLQWQTNGGVGWLPLPTVPGDAREFFIPIGYDSVGLTYNVRLRGNAGGENPGPWYQASLTIASYTIAPSAPTLVLTPIITGVSAAITPPDQTPVTEYRLYVSASDDFSTSVLATHGTSSPLIATGYAPVVLWFWATTVNGAGVESTPSAGVSAIPLPVGYDDLKSDLQAFSDFTSNALRDLQTEVGQIAQTVIDLALGGYSDVQTLKSSITSTAASITAAYTSAITAATGPGSSLVTDITTLQSALSGYLGASAVSTAVNSLQTQITTNGTNISLNSSDITTIKSALSGYLGSSAVSTAVNSLQTQITTNGTNISTNSASITALQSALSGYTGASAVSNAVNSLQTQITTDGTNISANASAITAVSSQVGNVYASGLFRVNTSSTPAGADARITLEVAASSGGSPYAAALYLDAMTGGTSRVTIVASEFFVTDGTNNHAPFFFSGGTAYLDNAVINNLNANVLTAGTLDVGTIAITGTVTTPTMAGNAVTVPNIASAGSQTINNSGTFGTLVSLTFTTSGGDVLVQLTDYFVRSNSHSAAVEYGIFVDGSLQEFIWGGGSQGSFNIAVAANMLVTSLGAGSHTFTIQAHTDGNDPSCLSKVATIVCTELKK